MSNKLDDLIIKFKDENNTTGERIAYALKEYLSDFTEMLKEEIVTEKSPRKVNKVGNMLINCSDEVDCISEHMYPVVKDKGFWILASDRDDKTVLERINTGIRNCQNGDKTSFSFYQYRVPACYVYVEATKEELEELCQSNKYMLVVCDKDGKEHEIPYYMVWSELALVNCKKIWKMSQLYKDEKPIVYAPYAKRLFRIEIDVEELTSIKGIQVEAIDFKLKQNGLENKFLLNQELVWNVKIDDQSDVKTFEEGNNGREKMGLEITSTVSPVADVVHWKYLITELLPNQYIIPKDQSWPTFRIDSVSEKEIQFDFETEYSGSFERVTIYEINGKDFRNKQIFYPQYNAINNDKQYRIRSLADAYYEIKKFSFPYEIKLQNVQINKPDNKKIFKKYPVNMTIYDKGRFGYKNTNKLYVLFDCNEESTFVTDYINYVLDYLTFCYPEIGWEGAI